MVGMGRAPVVADASVLIHLSRIGRFELLRQLYEIIDELLP